MDVYHAWFNLKEDVPDLQFAEAARAYLERLKLGGWFRVGYGYYDGVCSPISSSGEWEPSVRRRNPGGAGAAVGYSAAGPMGAADRR